MTTYRVGIVGLTGIGAGPAPEGPSTIFGSRMPHSHAAGYAAHPRTDVVAVCDLVPELLGRFRARWKHVWPVVATYTDYRAMLAREGLDIISVVTSDDRHADIVVDAADTPVKGILCEKPIATTLADADRMIDAVERAGVPMVVDHTRRWLPEYHLAREILRSDELGALSRIVGLLGGPRAMIFRNGTHLVDAINFFAESDPQWVTAQLDLGQERYGVHYAGDGGHDPATDPGVTGMIVYQNGVIGFCSVSKRTAARFELDLLCERGRVRLLPGGVEVETRDNSGSSTLRRVACPQYVRSDTAAAIAELVGLVENGGEGQCPPREARKALEIILAMLRSQVTENARVEFPLGGTLTASLK